MTTKTSAEKLSLPALTNRDSRDSTGTARFRLLSLPKTAKTRGKTSDRDNRDSFSGNSVQSDSNYVTKSNAQGKGFRILEKAVPAAPATTVTIPALPAALADLAATR